MIVGRPIKLFITTAAILALFATGLRAAENKVIDAARKEGAVSFYTTMAATEGKLLADAFQTKYPFLKVEITRIGSEKILQRILTENRAGRGLFDVTSNSGFEMHLLNKARLLARYQSSEFNAFVADSKDSSGYWVDMYSNLRVITTTLGSSPKRRCHAAMRTCSTQPGKVPSVFLKRNIPGTPLCCGLWAKKKAKNLCKRWRASSFSIAPHRS